MGPLIAWLFTDRDGTSALDQSVGNPPLYPYLALLIVIGAILLASFYYSVEGRARIPFIKNSSLWKIIFDRMLKHHLPIWAFVGLFVIGFHWAIPSFFSWGIWTALWGLWGVGIAAYWVWYFVRDFPVHSVSYDRKVEKAKFLPSRGR